MLSPSISTGYCICICCAECVMAALSLSHAALSSLPTPSPSVETPRISNPCAAYWSRNSTSQGVSILHGAHHVAQKFTSTALPLKLSRDTFLPLKSSSAQGGAALPLSGETSSGIPAASTTSSPLVAVASSRSVACLRYSKFAHPAQAKVANINTT